MMNASNLLLPYIISFILISLNVNVAGNRNSCLSIEPPFLPVNYNFKTSVFKENAPGFNELLLKSDETPNIVYDKRFSFSIVEVQKELHEKVYNRYFSYKEDSARPFKYLWEKPYPGIFLIKAIVMMNNTPVKSVAISNRKLKLFYTLS